MAKPDYDTTIARIAGNIAGPICAAYVGTPENARPAEAKVIASVVRLARAIVAEVKRTSDPDQPDDEGGLTR